MASEPAPLAATRTSTGETVWSATAPIDAYAVRRNRAAMDRSLAELSGRTLTHDASVEAHAADRVTGSVTLAYEIAANGEVRRRILTTDTIVTGASGKPEHEHVVETTARQLLLETTR